MEQATSGGAVPDFSKGVLVVSFEMGGKRCDLLADCPVANAEIIPEGLRFHFPYCLLISDLGTKALEGVLSHEVSMFGTQAYSYINKSGNRITLAPAGNKTTARRFLSVVLYLLGKETSIFSKEQLAAVTRSVRSQISTTKDDDFSFFQKLGIKRRLKVLMAKVNKLESYIGGYINVCHQLSTNSLATLTQWDVTNPVLSAYLDYIYGVATYGCKDLFQEDPDQDAILNAFMARIVGSQFIHLPLARFCVEHLASISYDFVATHSDEYKCPVFPMEITVENGEHIWAKRMMMGVTDFKNFAAGKAGVFPAGLFELGLVRGVDEESR